MRFGRLTAIRPAGRKGKHAAWLFRCDCGNEHVTRINRATDGTTISCGCFRREHNSLVKRTHGLTGSLTYVSWQAMKSRCFWKPHSEYHRYGGRGITVCQRWIDSFETFLADMGERPGLGWSLERLDNSRGYDPNNCTWIPKRRQSQNQRSNVRVTMEGENVCISEACRRLGISRINVYKRLEMGWTIEDALHRPMMKKPRHRLPA